MVETHGRACIHGGSQNANGRGHTTRRCRFARRPGLWTLRGDCATSETIALPRGFALDGNGGTISLMGDAEVFASAGVRVSGAGVRNLTLDGSGLKDACPGYLAALVVGGPGDIEDVTVANVRFGGDRDRAVGIEVAVFDGDAVALRNVAVANIGGTALLLVGDGSITVADSTARDATRNIQSSTSVAVAGADPDWLAAAHDANAARDECSPTRPRAGATIIYHPCHELHRDRRAPRRDRRR